ncbi:MAG: hypothetical protein JW809_15585 [Pirellulales bacterium]|nr:hypothetical protein [Pirellulales bacterium]
MVAVLEVGGELKAENNGKTASPKINVAANLLYDERTLDWPAGRDGTCSSIRHYDRADAVITAGDQTIKPSLRPQRRLIGVAADAASPTLFSPQGNLTRDELDLVDVLGNSLVVDRLLPGGPVRQRERWSHSDAVVAALLGLDSVRGNTVASTLAQVDKTSALVEMSGKVEGVDGGGAARIEVKAKYRFNLASKRIDWLGLLVHEDRSASAVNQGFDVVARLRLQVQPLAESDDLTDEALAKLPREPDDALVRLVFEPAGGGWRFSHDRRWYARGSEDDAGSLCYVDGGELVAQCNVAPLAPVAPGKQATLEQFQDDVRKALGKDFKEFVSAGQRANEKDYRVLRVVARGEVSEVPVQWHYYLVADQHGRQVAFTFTVEGRLVERLGNADGDLVRSFQFTDHDVAANP